MQKIVIMAGLILCVGLCVGCSTNVYDVELPIDTTDKVAFQEFNDRIADLPALERKLVGAYILRMEIKQALKQGDGIPKGTTVKDAIEKQREFQKSKTAPPK